MSVENNTQEQTTPFQFNNYLKAGAVSMLTLGTYFIINKIKRNPTLQFEYLGVF